MCEILTRVQWRQSHTEKRSVFFCTSKVVSMTTCTLTPIASTLVAACVVVYLMNGEGNDDALTIRALLTLLWPVVVLSLLQPEDSANVGVVPATLWMGLMWWIDSYSLVRNSLTPPDDLSSGNTKNGFGNGMRFDSHTVTAMSFGLCGLVGARYDSKYTHFILYALMTCVMFVLPVHNLPESEPFTETVNEVQRMCLVYSIALVITGIALTRSTKVPST